MKDNFWFEDPSILFNFNKITKLWPNSTMTRNEKLNAISRLIIILTLIGVLITQGVKMIITGTITLGIIVLLYYIENNKSKKKEAFSEMSSLQNTFTLPTEKDPLMNVKLTDYTDNPNRSEAAPSFEKNVEEEINENTKKFVISQFDNKKDIEKKLFSDLGDNYIFDQSMRNFYTMPNTKIPNDQKSFAEFCYGNMISCKEGNPTACLKNIPRYTTPYP